MAHHPATNSQISAGSVTTGRLNYEYGFTKLYVLDLPISELYRSGIDVRSRSFYAPGANRQTHSSNAQAADLCSGSRGGPNLHFFNNDTSNAATADNINTVRSNPVDFGARANNRSRFHFGDARSCRVIVAAQPQIRRCNTIGPRTSGRQAARAKLARRRSQHSVFHFRARILKNQTGDRRSVASLRRCAQLTQPAEIRSGSHYATHKLHIIELKISRAQKRCDCFAVDIVGFAVAGSVGRYIQPLQAYTVSRQCV